MDESDALCDARGAVHDAMKRQGDDKEQAIQELHAMADKDPHFFEALRAVGLMDLQAEQAVKH